MQVYVEGDTLLIDVTESPDEASLDVFIVDNGSKQRIEGRLTISAKRAVRLKVARRVQATPAMLQ